MAKIAPKCINDSSTQDKFDTFEFPQGQVSNPHQLENYLDINTCYNLSHIGETSHQFEIKHSTNNNATSSL